jgi:lipoic acid synthetase
VLEHAKAHAPDRMTKSSLMVGAGETDAEVEECLADLKTVGVDIVTLGQYLRPGPKHLAVDRYVEPEKFTRWSDAAREMGFRFVASGPLVRSSYRAAELFVRGELGQVVS